MIKYVILITLLLLEVAALAQTKQGTIKVRTGAVWEKEVVSSDFDAPMRDASTLTTITIVENMPTFKGGKDAMDEFIRSNIVYPDSVQAQRIEGTVWTTFVVTTNGSLADFQILESLHPDLDKEALRVVQLMPDWNAGTQRGIPVMVQVNVPIEFSLE